MVEIAIIISKQDYAGLNIQKHLLATNQFNAIKGKLFDFSPVYVCITQEHTIKMYTTEKYSIHCEHIDSEIDDCGAIIFPTTHRSAQAVPAFTVHPPGNFSDAPLGGIAGKLNSTLARLMRVGFEKLKEHAVGSIYKTAMECTHHGPDLDTPCMFFELGSSEQRWRDPDGGKRVAAALMGMVSSQIPEYTIAIGIGGPHYCPNFVKVMERSNIAFGHVCPKWALASLTKEKITDALEKSNARLVVLDWKGLGGEKERVVKMLDELGVAWKKCDEFKG